MSSSGSLSGKAEESAPALSRSIAPARAPRVRQPKIPWLTDLLVRYRRPLMALAVLVYVVSFNGRWRIGLDSSIYRGLARSIARGQGYHFGDFGSGHAYPGLPLLLAGINKLVGENFFRPALAQFVIVLMALLTIWVTYRLVKLHYPQWMAIAVACGLAVNARFLGLANELLTDVPFLLGVMTSLYGWELLRAARHGRKRAGAVVLLTLGLLLAAVMRPTFWVLGLAWLCACIWGLIVGPRKFHLFCLGILLVVWTAFACFDPRTSGFAPLGGGYEREAVDIVTDSGIDADSRVATLIERLRSDLPTLLENHLPAAFFGVEMHGPAGVIFSILLIGSALLLIRRHRIWGLLVLFTIVVTIVIATAPRYYVMIMPFLLLGSLVLLTRLTDRIPGGWGDLLLLAWMGMVIGTNLGRILPFITSQHSVSLSDSTLSFYSKYHEGKYLPVIHLAGVVHDRVGPDDKVIAPAAPVVAYLSDRPVLMERDLLPLRRGARHYPEHLASQGIRYAVFPASAYRDKNPELARLIRMHVLYPKKKIASVDGMMLARAQVWVPPGDWREGPNLPATKPAKHATSKPVHPPKHKSPASRAKRNVDASTTMPATQPAPTKKKKKPATRPTESALNHFSNAQNPFSMFQLDALAWRNSSDFRA